MKGRPKRVVLDTNVVVSSYWGGKPKRIIELWMEGRFKLVVSPAILQEYQEVLERFSIQDEDLEAFFALLTAPRLAIVVRPDRHYDVIPEDPSDNIFLDCAVAGGADHIVSGDTHLLKLGTFTGIPILNPAAFLRKLTE